MVLAGMILSPVYTVLYAEKIFVVDQEFWTLNAGISMIITTEYCILKSEYSGVEYLDWYISSARRRKAVKKRSAVVAALAIQQGADTHLVGARRHPGPCRPLRPLSLASSVPRPPLPVL